ncbi:MAG TPA: hypothetical protein DHW15_01365 [Bacteroidetes bacterium]|jgi:cytochrome c peroxidase|nr:MAG: hypothetical protein ABR94_11245 [Sphingobacteriales bacterium BACL12 MAG-120802-bin5]KRP08645.1 MAG: hypothetical protein ABR95_05645 [Sphingobacteriales bacterium BACL12 MAG-120813-bin55]HCK20845.1 hypothetical protein [Bacteroidota bacterium]
MRHVIFLCVPLLLLGCNRDETEDITNATYGNISDYLSIDLNNLDNYSDYDYPVHIDQNIINAFDNTPVTNPVTDEGATLGRVLF